METSVKKPWYQRNLTRMEMVLTLLLVVLVSGLYTYRTLSMVKVDLLSRTFADINATLNYRAALLIMSGQRDSLQDLSTMNPFLPIEMDFNVDDFDGNENTLLALALLGENKNIEDFSIYGGELETVDNDRLEKGKWYFVKDDHTVIYVMDHMDRYKLFDRNKNIPILRYDLKMYYKDNNENGQFDSDTDDFRAIKLELVRNH